MHRQKLFSSVAIEYIFDLPCAGPASELLMATATIESPNAEQYSVLLQTFASASDMSTAANGPAAAVNILCIRISSFYAPNMHITSHLYCAMLQIKLRLFGHICRMNDSRKIKTLVFGMMDGSNKRGRPHQEWSDDIEQWCGATLQEFSHAALDRQRWAAIVRMASDTNGH